MIFGHFGKISQLTPASEPDPSAPASRTRWRSKPSGQIMCSDEIPVAVQLWHQNDYGICGRSPERVV